MRLGIDYGTVVTRAVLAAQRRAETDPAGLVPHPKRHIADGTVAVRGQPVQVVDLIAATLRRVGEQATQVAGQPVSDVTLTVPAGWGPARRTVLRRAATRAGLAQPHLLEAPVAVAGHLQSAGITIPVGAAILLCDFGAGRFEATVLARTSGGFEVVSTIDTPDAAGLALDAVLAGHVATLTATLTPTLTPAPADAADAGASGRPDRVDGGLGAVHAAIQALATNPAVAVPAGTGPPVVVDRPTLRALTRPLLAHAAHTATAAVAAADLTIDALAGVYCHGAGTPPAVALDALTETLPTATGLADPQAAAVLRAATAHPTGQTRHPALHRRGRPRPGLAAAAGTGHPHRAGDPLPRLLRPDHAGQGRLGRIRPGRTARAARRPRRRRARRGHPHPQPAQGRPGHPTANPPATGQVPARRRRRRGQHRRPLRRHRRAVARRAQRPLPGRHPAGHHPHRHHRHRHRPAGHPPPPPPPPPPPAHAP